MVGIGDAKRSYLLTNGSASANINDMEFEWLGLKIINPTKANELSDRWSQYWDELAVPAGNFNDRAFLWLSSMGHAQDDLPAKWISFWLS